MRYRNQLQPYIEISTSPVTQEARFAAQVGHGKTGVACVNISKNLLATGSYTFDFETATDAGSPHWDACGSGTVAAAFTGLKRFDLGESSGQKLACVVRWKLTGATASAVLGFDIVIIFADT